MHKEIAKQITAGVELSVLRAVPPAQALTAVLANVYGSSPYNSEVVTSLLGGEGRELDRSDLTISEHTEVDYRLLRVDEDTYNLVMQVGYSFKDRVPADKFIIFATSDATLRDSIVVGCPQPLFELWFVPDDPIKSLFHESVDRMLPSVRIDLKYLDEFGNSVNLLDHKPELTEVRVGRWQDYLTFFREPLGNLQQLRPEHFMSSLRVFEIDLGRIAGSEGKIRTIQQLRLRSMTLQRVADNYCFWQAPYPCFVDRMHIDATSLALDSHDEFLFRLQTFAFRSHSAPARWARPDEVKELDVRSWLLPGHGVALLWKRVTDDGTAERR